MFNKWRKTRIEDVKQLESELKKIKDKTDASILTFLGVSDNIKGLNLIYVAEETFNSKLFAGTFAEFYQKIDDIRKEFLNDDLQSGEVRSFGKNLLIYPISNTVVFLCIIPSGKHKKVIDDWYVKNQLRLKDIFKN